VVLLAATAVLVAGCGAGRPAAVPRLHGGSAPPRTRHAAASTSSAPCDDAQVRSAVSRFFTDWNGRDPRALGRLFSPSEGELDLATKDQDTLHDSEWSEAMGRRGIAAFAAAQWRLGENFIYHGMDIYSPTGGLGGAEVDRVRAIFGDGDLQPVEEAKFNYSCGQGLTHVVIISAARAKPKKH